MVRFQQEGNGMAHADAGHEGSRKAMNHHLEFLTLPLFLMVALLAGPRLPRWMHRLCRWGTWLADHRRLAVVLVGVGAFLGSVATTLALGWPQPNYQDEYSYLLQADTFVHGRLTNPPHPLWEHFETFQEIQQPTYASKYPPAQGVVLAAGQLFTGQPIVGVWLSMALAGAALCWMLQAWFPPRWALLGASLVTLRLVFSGHAGAANDMTWGYWSRGYFGGALAVAGGALLYGALRRCLQTPRVRYALLMGIGLALLANTRPFEGLIVSLPAGVVLLAWMVGKQRPPLLVSLRRVVLPLLAVLLLTGAIMALYNQSVTGSPLRLPYQVHEETYAANPLFFWQDLRPTPAYRHSIIETFWMGWVLDLYQLHRSTQGFLGVTYSKIQQLGIFYLGIWLSIALFAAFLARRDRWLWLALGTCVLLLVMLMQLYCYTPHYAAPALGLLAVLVVAGLRQLHAVRWRGRPAGRALVCVIVLYYPLLAWLSVLVEPRIPENATHIQRAQLLEQLRQDGDEHLVLVRYHNPKPRGFGHEDWVFNEADIDASRVVWAREISPEKDRHLLDYYPGRRVWLLEVEVDRQTYRLSPYSQRELTAQAQASR